MNPTIIGIGSALPLHSMTQDECFHYAKDFCCVNPKQERFMDTLFKKTEIGTRSLVAVEGPAGARISDLYSAPNTNGSAGPSTAERMFKYRMEIGPLAENACQAALHDAEIHASSITHLVTASCTGFSAPGLDLHLLEHLELQRTVSRTHIGFMGCHGALNALRVAQGFCLAHPDAVVLVCAAELCSLHFQFGWLPQSLVANSLFADGAAGLILTARQNGPRYSSCGSYVVPDSAGAMSWHIGDSGFIMQLANNVPELIENNLPDFMSSFLARENLSISDIGGWAVHPGGPRILDSVQSCLGLDDGALSTSRQILSECGNMSSPTVLFILQRLLALGDKLPVIMLGFGPGLTIEAALIR